MLDPSKFQFGKNVEFFMGVVENNLDPDFMDRVQVRIFGKHSPKTEDIKTIDLPWAYCLKHSPSQTETGVGGAMYVPGSWVAGVSLDGEMMQHLLILGSISGAPDPHPNLRTANYDEWGFKDTRKPQNLQAGASPMPPKYVKTRQDDSPIEIVEREPERFPRKEEESKPAIPRTARGIGYDENYLVGDWATSYTNGEYKKIFKEPMLSKYRNIKENIPTAETKFSWNQPNPPFAAIYPFNHVNQTESGHIIELDDTPGAERIHTYHRSGTFCEMHASGTQVNQVMNQRYDITQTNDYEYIGGSHIHTVNKSYKLLVNAAALNNTNYTVKIGPGGHANILTDRGNINFQSQAGDIIQYGNNIECRSRDVMMLQSGKLILNTNELKMMINSKLDIQTDGGLDFKTAQIAMSASQGMGFSSGADARLDAMRSIKIIAQNTWKMPLVFIPYNVGLETISRIGHNQMVAESGDIRLYSKRNKALSPDGKIVITSSDRTAMFSIANPQDAPNFENVLTHPGSIIMKSDYGYIYGLAEGGNIELETKRYHNIKLKTTRLGSLIGTAGEIKMTSTLMNIELKSRLNTDIEAGLALTTSSRMDTKIEAGMSITEKANFRVDIEAGLSAAIHVKGPGGCRLGERTATSPALAGDKFVKAFMQHTHLTAVGKTSPPDIISDPTLSTAIMESFCLKTFVK